MTLHARTDDPSTSHAAMKGLSKLKMRILKHLEDCINHGTTNKEIAKALTTADKKVERDHISPNMKPLEEAGLIRRTGYRRGTETVWLHMNYSNLFSPLEGDRPMEVKPRKPSRAELVEALQVCRNNLQVLSNDGESLSTKHAVKTDLLKDIDNILTREKG